MVKVSIQEAFFFILTFNHPEPEVVIEACAAEA